MKVLWRKHLLAVVEGEKVKLAEFADQLAKIKANMEQIAVLRCAGNFI